MTLSRSIEARIRCADSRSRTAGSCLADARCADSLSILARRWSADSTIMQSARRFLCLSAFFARRNTLGSASESEFIISNVTWWNANIANMVNENGSRMTECQTYRTTELQNYREFVTHNFICMMDVAGDKWRDGRQNGRTTELQNYRTTERQNGQTMER